MAYNFHFTDKNIANVKKLNLYELQHAIYDAMGDFDTPETKEQGRAKLRGIYDELKRRGFTNMVTPEPLR